MSKITYPHLVAPAKVGNNVLKNHIIATASTAGYLQGPENYSPEGVIQAYTHKAKTAAIVTCNGWGNTPVKSQHAMIWDWAHGGAQHHITRLTESIHYYGSLAETFLFPEWDDNFDVGEGIPKEEPYFQPGLPAFTKKHIDEMIQRYADDAARAQEVGFDGAYIHAAYRGLPIARFLSPLTNNREDEFGGSVENRARFLLMVCDAIKAKCGKDFILEVSISGEDHVEGGVTLQDTIEVIKLGEGHFDLVQPRSWGLDPAHPAGYNKNRIPYQYMTKAIKDAGCKIPVVGVAGYLYPEHGEEAIASGIMDFMGMGRAWVSNPNYDKVLYEGQRDELVPCIRCNKCYNGGGSKVPYRDLCSVNPMWGWESREHLFKTEPEVIKNIAVVGGGPAGMEAAITAAKRGHIVTLFEMTDKLGGQLNQAEVPSFKWPVRDFKQFLIDQCYKYGVDVRLNTKADQATLEAGNYDEIIAAVGAEANLLKVPGWDKANVMPALDVYGQEDTLPEKVLIVGGGEIGAETGMHLAELGHKVQLIEMTDRLAPDAPFFHFRSMLIEYADNTENFEYIVNAKCKEITDTGLIYTDKDGNDVELFGDKVIMATGSKGKTDEAMALYAPGRRALMIGDCVKASTIQNAMRTGYATASLL